MLDFRIASATIRANRFHFVTLVCGMHERCSDDSLQKVRDTLTLRSLQSRHPDRDFLSRDSARSVGKFVIMHQKPVLSI
jgi:hypothetical protein